MATTSTAVENENSPEDLKYSPPPVALEESEFTEDVYDENGFLVQAVS